MAHNDHESLRRVLAKIIQYELEKRRSEITDHVHRVASVFGMTPDEVKEVAKPVLQHFVDEVFDV